MSRHEPSLAVIIPTYRRNQDVLRALASLQEQSLPSFEVVVVDNAADRQLEQEVRSAERRAGVMVTYVAEPRLGLHNARHAGARASAADVLVYTDDDATFSPDWLASLQSAFGQHDAMAVAGGPVRAVWEKTPPDWLVKYMEGRTDFGPLSLREPHQTFVQSADESAYGVNFAIRREVLFALGGFNPESFGDHWLGDGESGLVRKVTDSGRLIGYVPGALVWHHVPASRMTVAYLARRMANEGACIEYAYFRRQPPTVSRVTQRFARALASLLLCWPRQAVLRVKGGSPAPWLDARLHWAMACSRLSYLVRVARSAEMRGLIAKRDWLNE